MTKGKYYRHKNSGAIALATTDRTATILNPGTSTLDLGQGTHDLPPAIWEEVEPVLAPANDAPAEEDDDAAELGGDAEEPGDDLEF